MCVRGVCICEFNCACANACVCMCVFASKRQQAHNGFLILGNQKQIIEKKTDPAQGKLGTDGQMEAGNQESETEKARSGEKKLCMREGQWGTTKQGCDREDKEEVGEGEEEVRERTRAQWGEEKEERGTVGGERSGFPCPVKRK